MPATAPVNVVVYVPGVFVADTAPNVPVLLPPVSEKANALFVKPVTAFPAASTTTIVTVLVVPEASVDEAKLTEELLPLTAPGVTWTVGWDVSCTLSTVVVSVLALPAISPVNVVVYVPGVDVWVTVSKVPVLAPERLKLKSLPGKPAMGLPEAVPTTSVTTLPVPEAAVADAKLTVDSLPLTELDVTWTVGWE